MFSGIIYSSPCEVLHLLGDHLLVGYEYPALMLMRIHENATIIFKVSIMHILSIILVLQGKKIVDHAMVWSVLLDLQLSHRPCSK